LEDDELVTHVSVETDMFLEALSRAKLSGKALRVSGSPVEQHAQPLTIMQKAAAFIRWRKRMFWGKKAWHVEKAK